MPFRYDSVVAYRAYMFAFPVKSNLTCFCVNVSCVCVRVVNETRVQSSPPASQTDCVAPANHQSSKNEEVAAPSPARASTKHSKKQKNETDKGTQALK